MGWNGGQQLRSRGFQQYADLQCRWPDHQPAYRVGWRRRTIRVRSAQCGSSSAPYSTRSQDLLLGADRIARAWKTSGYNGAVSPAVQCGTTRQLGGNMCDQDHFEDERKEYERRGLVTRKQF